MLSSPYAVPSSRLETAIVAGGWLIGALVAPWILTFPPVTYEGMGLVASYGWGVMFGAGAILIAIGHMREEYRIEIPGIGLVLGGIAVYLILTWGQVIAAGSMGSGSRGLLLVPFAVSYLLVRLLRLIGHHLRIQSLQRIARGPDGSP